MNTDELNRLLGKRETNCKHSQPERLARALYYELKAGVEVRESSEWHRLEQWEVDLLCAWYEMGCKR